MKIRVYYEGINFRLKGWKKIKGLVEKVIAKEGKFSGDLNFILAGDEYIRDINKKFLNHDWYTDVISFTYNEQAGINGEIFISTETVKKNALNYNVSYKEEMIRVIVHGVLHLCGFEDNSACEKENMRKKEDYWIKKFKEI